ncbi:GerAB/ArcD/ProY family transporter [Bacillus pfraonensis]|uniref:GerAB/ArcD/ProY family transporter n=1 Tax=Bacillus TaxID=1386 RepID=UPI002A5289AB|nr:GerAB/ArcD/ProY family transporter [Bacillus pseudomycoides]
MNKVRVKESSMVTPFFVFFLVHSSQTGVGVLGYQRELIQGAGHDAWQSILITGISIHIVIKMMYSVLKYAEDGDLISINNKLFGKNIGYILSSLFIGYMIVSAIIVIRAYIEILQVWIFPTVHTWEFTLLILIVIYYIVAGGFRAVTGISFWSVIIPSFLIITVFFLIKYMVWNNFLPVFNHDIFEVLQSAKASTFMYLGFETLFLYYPFIKNRDKSVRWAHLATLTTTTIYLMLTIISFGYFTQGEIKHTVWATLILTKVFELPFVERIEYIIIFIWFFIILPPICCAIWGSTRGIKRMFNVKPKISLVCICIVIFVFAIFIDKRIKIEKLSDITSNIGFYILYAYIPLMYIMMKIKQAFQK